MDVLSVLKATQFVKDWVTSGKGPIVYEVASYRFSGHSVSDPGTTYRTKVRSLAWLGNRVRHTVLMIFPDTCVQDEVQESRRLHDPITRLKKLLLDAPVVEPAELKVNRLLYSGQA
jgi:pyruvate dehydrogenase E1 component alpha subunit